MMDNGLLLFRSSTRRFKRWLDGSFIHFLHKRVLDNYGLIQLYDQDDISQAVAFIAMPSRHLTFRCDFLEPLKDVNCILH